MLRVRNGGVRCSVVLSSLARYSVSWLGLVRSCFARLSNVRHGFSLRGLALCGTVLSSPVRQCKAWLAKVLLWCGGAGSGPVGSSPVWFCKARRFLERSCAVAWGKVERGFVLLGKVSFWQGGPVQSEVRYARLLCGDVLYAVAKFCPVKYCYVRHGKALLWLREVRFCSAGHRGVLYCLALLRSGIPRYGTVGSGFARLRAVGQGLLLLRSGVGKQGCVMRGAVTCSTVRSSSELFRLGQVLRCPARFCSVKSGTARTLALLRRGQVWLGTVLSCDVLRGNLRHYFGLVMQGGVQLCRVRQGRPRYGNEE